MLSRFKELQKREGVATEYVDVSLFLWVWNICSILHKRNFGVLFLTQDLIANLIQARLETSLYFSDTESDVSCSEFNIFIYI